MSSVEDIEFDACEDIKRVETDVKVEAEGSLLRISVYLNKVHRCREIIVGVQVYVEGSLYAMKTKKVFTGDHPSRKKINEFYVGDFCFLFTDTSTDDIDVDVLAHYIY